MKTYQTEIQIRFRQADPAGILFFGEIFSLAHDCFEEFIESTGIDWKTWFQNKEYMAPIRHTDCNYLKPFFAGEKYTVSVNVLKFGETSFQMQYVFSKDNTTHAQVTMAHAFLNAKTYQKIPVPPDLKSKLSAYLVKT